MKHPIERSKYFQEYMRQLENEIDMIERSQQRKKKNSTRSFWLITFFLLIWISLALMAQPIVNSAGG